MPTAPSGRYDDVRPLAIEIMSGTTSQWSTAHQRPVRPKPAHHLVGDEQDAVAVADLAQALHVAVGRNQDAVRPTTGSMMIAAIVCGPS